MEGVGGEQAINLIGVSTQRGVCWEIYLYGVVVSYALLPGEWEWARSQQFIDHSFTPYNKLSISLKLLCVDSTCPRHEAIHSTIGAYII